LEIWLPLVAGAAVCIDLPMCRAIDLIRI